MEFNDAYLFTSAYADDVMIGSKGYFADTLTELKRKVREGGSLAELTAINNEDAATRFCASSVSSYFLFYKVKDPEVKTMRPYKDTAEMPCGIADCAIHKGTGDKLMIIGISECKVYIASKRWMDMQELFDDYVWPNGSPCGMEETEDEKN